MQHLWPDDSTRCVPLTITAPDAAAPGHLGGNPPQGLTPGAARLRYFATVPFAAAPELRLSIFVADFKEILACRGRVVPLGLLDVHIHGPRPIDTDSPFASPLSPCGIKMLDAREDQEVDDQGVVFPFLGHKLGGVPFLIRRPPELTEDLRESSMGGLIHVVQFVFPGPDEPVEGSWPFGDGVFHLFGRPPYSAGDWRWLWDL